MSKPKTFMDQVAGEDFYLPAHDVRKIIGVDAGSFQQWLARELIPFEMLKAGKRTWRRFHVRDLPRLVMAASIWSNGLLISDALAVTDLILGHIGKEKRPDWVLYFRSTGTVYCAYADQKYPLGDVFNDFHSASCIFISMDALDRQIEAALFLAKRTAQASV